MVLDSAVISIMNNGITLLKCFYLGDYYGY